MSKNQYRIYASDFHGGHLVGAHTPARDFVSAEDIAF
jgi:hypothetical protein